MHWYVKWLIDTGGTIASDAVDTAERELTLLKAEYGEVPAEFEQLMLDGFGHMRRTGIFPLINGVGDLPALLPHDPTNEHALAFMHHTGGEVLANHHASVASGHAPSHPVLLASKEDSYVALECKGPRAGWVYDYQPGAAGWPTRPIARSLTECFEGFRRMVDAGVLELVGGALVRSRIEGAPLPPEGTPMLFLGEVERPYSSLFDPSWPQPVLDGQVSEVLGFEIPQPDDQPLGLTECFQPEGGWIAGRERVARLRTELGL